MQVSETFVGGISSSWVLGTRGFQLSAWAVCLRGLRSWDSFFRTLRFFMVKGTLNGNAFCSFVPKPTLPVREDAGEVSAFPASNRRTIFS